MLDAAWGWQGQPVSATLLSTPVPPGQYDPPPVTSYAVGRAISVTTALPDMLLVQEPAVATTV